MKALAILALVLTLGGCSTLGNAPATINTPLDHLSCLLTMDTDQSRYYQAMEVDRMVTALSYYGGTFHDVIATAQEFKTPLRSARELCKKTNELRELLHQYYLSTGKYLAMP